MNNRGLEFLLDCFTDKHMLNLKMLKDMNEEQLEEVLEGKLYVKRMKDELNKLQLDWLNSKIYNSNKEELLKWSKLWSISFEYIIVWISNLFYRSFFY